MYEIILQRIIFSLAFKNRSKLLQNHMRSSFTYLNATQFLDALNENLFKYIVVYFLIYYQGNETSSIIMAATGAVFILPFILFSSVGGVFADLYSKTKIIRITRIIALIFMILALIMMIFPMGNWIYPILFIVAALSAIFGPSKYGIIPEIVSEANLVKANAYIAAFTYFGIIFGTALASLLDSITNEIFPVMMLACIAVAVTGLIASYKIPHMEPAHPDKRWPKFVYKEISDSIKDMKQKPLMLTAVFCYSYFLFIGAYVQMNIIPYSITDLKMSAVVGGYLFLFSSIGVGIGALIASKMSGKLTSLPFSGIGMSIGCFLFTLISHPFWINIIWLVGLGIFAGMFLVPPQAFILAHSSAENKGRNFGTANFFSFISAFVAAGVLFLFNSILDVNPAWSFTLIGIINLVVVVFLFFKIYSRKNSAI